MSGAVERQFKWKEQKEAELKAKIRKKEEQEAKRSGLQMNRKQAAESGRRMIAWQQAKEAKIEAQRAQLDAERNAHYRPPKQSRRASAGPPKPSARRVLPPPPARVVNSQVELREPVSLAVPPLCSFAAPELGE